MKVASLGVLVLYIAFLLRLMLANLSDYIGIISTVSLAMSLFSELKSVVLWHEMVPQKRVYCFE